MVVCTDGELGKRSGLEVAVAAGGGGGGGGDGELTLPSCSWAAAAQMKHRASVSARMVLPSTSEQLGHKRRLGGRLHAASP